MTELMTKNYNFKCTFEDAEHLTVRCSDDRYWYLSGQILEGFLYQFGGFLISRSGSFVIRSRKEWSSWSEPVLYYDIYDLNRPFKLQKVEVSARLSLINCNSILRDMFEVKKD